ncbi:HNH endonuclease [Mycobacterium sp. PS03-16]|uniref:HNH endonuclease n=1 Tax=Mycobacterium sp. PS03-16 TaxID=2559611 RepID=UPI003528F40C
MSSVRKPCVEPGCPNYVETTAVSARQSVKRNRCRDHQRAFDRAYDRVRDGRPNRVARNDSEYRAIRKPIGLRCALRIAGVCTGWATTWDHKTPLAAGGTHHRSNLQPACVPCNSSKGAQISTPKP